MYYASHPIHRVVEKVDTSTIAGQIGQQLGFLVCVEPLQLDGLVS